jgi:phage-related protein
MAAKGIKGITVEIDGNVTPLNKALANVNKTSRELQGELRGINTLLRLDPGNTDLMAQKQVVLKEAIVASEGKLKTLILAQQKMNAEGADLNSETYRDLQREIISTKSKLGQLANEEKQLIKLTNATKTFGQKIADIAKKVPVVDKLGTGFKNLASKIANAVKENEQVKKIGTAVEGVKQKVTQLKDKVPIIGKIESAFKQVGPAVTALSNKMPKLSAALSAVGTAAKKISSGGLKVLTTTVGGATKAFGGFVAGAGALALAAIGASANAAMSLEATQAKYNTVFKGYTGQMDETIQKFQQLTPATKAAAQSMSAGIQDLLVPMGVARDKATDMTSETMNLVGALTNFNSETHTAEEVQTAFSSALTGEYTSLKALGIQVSAETVKQKAFEMGLADSAKSADKAAQAQALLALATEQSGDALAAYNEESLDAKTRMGLLKSDITDMAAGLGTALLPAANDMLKVVREVTNDIMPDLNNLFQSLAGILSNQDGAIQSFSDNFASLFETIMGKATDAIPTLVGVVTTLLPAMLPAFMALVDGIVDMIPVALPQIISAAVAIFSGLISGIEQTTPKIMDMLPGLIENISGVINANLPSIITSGVNILASLITGIANSIPTLINGITSLIPVIMTTIQANAPTLIQAGLDTLTALVDGILQGIPMLIAMLPQIINTIANIITENLPLILETGMTLLNSLIDGIITTIPMLVDMLPQIIDTITLILTENLPYIIQTGIDLLNSLINGIINALPQLIAALPKIISTIINFIINNLPMIISAGIQLIGALIAGLIQAIPMLIAAIPEIVIAIFDTFASINWGEIGGNIIAGIADGVKNAAGNLVSSVVEAAKSAVNGVKEFLEIRSPSRKLKREVGKMMAAGVGVGYVDEMETQTENMKKATPTTFDSYTARQSRKANTSEAVQAGGYNQTIYNYSPKALSPSETARQTRNATRQMILRLKGA